jgi:ABC-type multidrug transport system fused ATPase/permease subunit
MRLSDLLRRFQRGIVVALLLVGIERIAWVIEPSAFGPVLDAFVDLHTAERTRFPWGPVAIWIAIFALNSVVGAIRRSVDQRIYSRMFADIASEVSRISLIQGLSPTQTAARAELSREYIDFVQFRLPEILEESIALLGALVGLAVYDIRIALVAGLVAVPVAVFTLLYRRKVTGLQTELHESMERSFDAFATRDPEAIRAYYLERAGPQQRIANWGATTFGVTRVFLLVVFLVVLYLAIDLDDFTTGKVYSIVAYLWTFITAIELLPELVESLTSLGDLAERLAAQQIDPEGEPEERGAGDHPAR